jgi:hypothetical protein
LLPTVVGRPARSASAQVAAATFGAALAATFGAALAATFGAALAATTSPFTGTAGR